MNICDERHNSRHIYTERNGDYHNQLCKTERMSESDSNIAQ
jgi:ribosomal protein L35